MMLLVISMKCMDLTRMFIYVCINKHSSSVHKSEAYESSSYLKINITKWVRIPGVGTYFWG